MSKPWPKKIFIYTDGASRGNPGPCALGVHILDREKQIVYEEGRYLESNNTNNFAEYKAVIYALELSIKHHVEDLHLFSDSELLIRQLNQKYKVKSAKIKPLYETCKKLLSKIPTYTFEHVRRDQNFVADQLANQALDENIS